MAALEIVRTAGREGPVVLASRMNRPPKPKTVGIEIVQQFDWQIPDLGVILRSGQSWATRLPCTPASKMMRGDWASFRAYPRLVVAQAENANRCTARWTAGPQREVTPMQAKPGDAIESQP